MSNFVNVFLEGGLIVTCQIFDVDRQLMGDGDAEQELDKALQDTIPFIVLGSFGRIGNAAGDAKGFKAAEFAPIAPGNTPQDFMILKSKMVCGYAFLSEKDSEYVGRAFFPSAIKRVGSLPQNLGGK